MHIETNNEQKNECGGYEQHSCHGKHKHMTKLITKIAIGLLIFWFGVQFGEMKGMLKSQFGGYKYRHGGVMPMMYGGGYGNGYWQEEIPVDSGASAEKAPAVK